jgi:FtsP/CotA-like multicopper oxidase with cupredoxin domain
MEARMSRLLSAAILLGAACAPAPSAEPPGGPRSLVFDHVAVVEVSTGVVLTDQAQTRTAMGDRRLSGETPDEVQSNDNRSPAGMLRDGVLEVHLEARPATWRAALRHVSQRLDQDGELEAGTTVLAFGEEGGRARIPGPLIRVPQGTEVRVTVRNSVPDSIRIGLPPPASGVAASSSYADPIMIVHGLRAGSVADDTLHVARGTVREVRFRADEPGTYVYRGAFSDRPIQGWTGRDAQLAGVIIIDPAGTRPDPDERVFVITMLDQFPDTALPPPFEDLFWRAINGESWPDTEDPRSRRPGSRARCGNARARCARRRAARAGRNGRPGAGHHRVRPRARQCGGAAAAAAAEAARAERPARRRPRLLRRRRATRRRLPGPILRPAGWP